MKIKSIYRVLILFLSTKICGAEINKAILNLESFMKDLEKQRELLVIEKESTLIFADKKRAQEFIEDIDNMKGLLTVPESITNHTQIAGSLFLWFAHVYRDVSFQSSNRAVQQYEHFLKEMSSEKYVSQLSSVASFNENDLMRSFGDIFSI